MPPPEDSASAADPEAQAREIEAQAAEIDRLRALMEQAMGAAAAAGAALQSHIASQTTQQPSKKKPDLPAFDKNNVEIWIQRVESAYTRAGITLAKDKFAFIECKFPVDYNPKINAFLFGDSTDDKWKEFIQYLKDEYGPTKRQQAAYLLANIPRNGARPSQLLATVQDKTKLLKMDDLHKEVVFKALPPSVQQHVVNQVESLSATELAELADTFFDREGKPLTSSTSVNAAVDDGAPQETEDSDDNVEVNAVGSKYKGVGRNFGNFYKSGKKPSNVYDPSRGNNNSKNNSSNSTKFYSVGNERLCHAHHKFGESAFSCRPGCSRAGQPLAKKEGNGKATRRA